MLSVPSALPRPGLAHPRGVGFGAGGDAGSVRSQALPGALSTQAPV